MSRKFVNRNTIYSQHFTVEEADVNMPSAVISNNWNSSELSHEESGCGGRSEILWSREKNTGNFGNDFFKNFQNGMDFSDGSDRSTSSCSWHNDDFDIHSSNQVSASLEAIEDALYDGKNSSLISQTVYEECIAWANKYSYIRIKGEYIAPTVLDDIPVQPSTKQTPNNIFLVEGKKMSLHLSEKHSKKTSESVSTPCDKQELNVDDCEECFEADIKEVDINVAQSGINEVTQSSEAMLNSAQDNIIDQLAYEIWPKVLELLNSLDDANKKDVDELEDFQLPPILSARRPRTEGTDTFSEFSSKFDHSLFISSKFSPTKKDTPVWKPTRALRPSSEIHSTRNSRLIPNSRLNRLKSDALRVSSLNLQPRTPIKLSSIKQIIQEEETSSSSIHLPVVDEDILPSSDISYKQDVKECSLLSNVHTNCWKRTDTFLPPIERKTNGTNSKFTRKLFTLNEADLKNDRRKRNGSALQNSMTPLPTSRPNTSASRKNTKYHRHFIKDFSSNDSAIKYSSTKNTNISSDLPVSLFPIVTPINPCKERNSSARKKGYQNHKLQR